MLILAASEGKAKPGCAYLGRQVWEIRQAASFGLTTRNEEQLHKSCPYKNSHVTMTAFCTCTYVLHNKKWSVRQKHVFMTEPDKVCMEYELK